MHSLDVKIYEPGEFAPDSDKITDTFGRVSDARLRKLEILLRETIQNSLDAALPIDGHDNPGTVDVDYRTGDFSAKDFSSFLPEKFASQFLCFAQRTGNRRFFAISDKNCVGLTGYVSRKLAKPVDGKMPPSNFFRLVYGYMNGKSRAEAGSGGSYGVGKTILFNFGAGMVVYYSRTQSEGSRLIIAYLTDVNNRLFSSDLVPDGAAWFGCNKEDSDIGCVLHPIVEECDIEKILSCFGLEPYGANESGTMSIIPFWNPGSLQSETEEGKSRKLVAPWESSELDFVRYTILKWYAPRLRGDWALTGKPGLLKYYKWGRCDYLGQSEESCGRGLTVRYNGCAISPYDFVVGSPEDKYPLFNLIRELYDLAAYDNAALVPGDYKFEVKLNSSSDQKMFFGDSGCVGWVVVRKIDLASTLYKDSVALLDSLCPANLSATGKGVFVYCRRPGMIVSYASDWADKIFSKVALKRNERLIGIFVANSSCGVYNSDARTNLSRQTCVDELFRNREGVDHNGWGVDGKQKFWPGLERNFVSLVVSSIEKSISKLFAEKVTPVVAGELPAVSRYMGALIGLQKGPGNGPGGNSPLSTGGNGRKGRAGTRTGGTNAHVAIKFSAPRFSKVLGRTQIEIPTYIKPIVGKFEGRFKLSVATDSGRFDTVAWAGQFPGEPYPVSLKKIDDHYKDVGLSCRYDNETACFIISANFATESEVQTRLVFELSTDRKVEVEVNSEILKEGVK